MEIKKAPKADLERYRPLWFLIGLATSLALVIISLEMMVFEREEVSLNKIKVVLEEEELIPITQQVAPPPPPPKLPQPTTVIRIVENDNEIETEIDIDSESDEETVIEMMDIPVAEEEEEVIEPEIFTIVEEMPTYPGGESEMYAYLKDNMEYPELAKDAGIQGIVFVSFVIEQDGSIDDVKVLRGIGGGCDEEAIRVVENMPHWNPGKQRAKPVRVQFNMPIRFVLRK